MAILPKAPAKRALVGAFLMSFGFGGLHVLAAYWSVAPHGDDTIYIHITWMFLVILLITGFGNFIYVFVAAIGKLFHLGKATWSQLGINFMFFSILTVGLLAATTMALGIRLGAFKAITVRGAPLIAAIEKYQAKEGKLPADVYDLTPDYLPAIPGTGVGSYPRYEYLTNSIASKYGGNPWILSVDITSDSLTRETLFYYPQQNYPKPPEVVSTHRMGKWADITVTKSSGEK